jgi:DNA phosphorothioation system restriction enzyme
MTSSLRVLALRDSYRSDECNIVREFYVPCLERSVRYRRAVGYFSSSSLTVAAKGLSVFLEKGGSMQLVASPHLSVEDVRAISEGYKLRADVVQEAVLKELKPSLDRLISHRLACLAWLIAKNMLEVRLAVVKAPGVIGIYHEKVGLFEDSEGNTVAFSGSPNESGSGLVDNFESIDVYASWRPHDETRVRSKQSAFARLWANETSRLEVVPFSEAARRGLLELRTERPPEKDPELTEVPTLALSVPEWLELRPYQTQAIEGWLRTRGRGILKMATGSGKTFIALALAARLFNEGLLRALVVVVPFRHLVTQWQREAAKFGLDAVACHEARTNWEGPLQDRVLNIKSGRLPFLAAVTTTRTFASDAFQKVISYLPEETLLVGDEVHNLGARTLVSRLPLNVPMRLGLSATPERWFDDSGSLALEEYFGKVLQPEFTLRDALKAGALVPYRYYPVLVELTEEERESYIQLSIRIAKALAAVGEHDGDEGLSDATLSLLARRARLLATASNKLPQLKNLLQTLPPVRHALFYCGDGSCESPTDQCIERHVEAVASLLRDDLGLRVETYVAETPLDVREGLRRQFAQGEIDGIVAIRCLDEGVDIPETRLAVILASARNPRQFVQRRGRVLRRAPGKEDATIVDMVVVPPPPDGLDVASFSLERQMFKNELERVMEFADLAENGPMARGELLEQRKRYNLLDL